MPFRLILTALTASLILSPEPARGQLEYDPSLPFTWLFDTGSPSSAPLTGKALADGVLGGKDGWTLVGEDNLDHAFGGDAVLLNDRLAVVLRARGPGAEVYSCSDGGRVNRAVLTALPDARMPISVTGLASITIIENSPASVVVQATFQTSAAGQKSSATFGITTGQRMVEMCPKSRADRLFAWYRPRWVVVPDFFGHDMVFDPITVNSNRFGLPAENFSLGLIHGNRAMMMCVWESGRRRSHLVRSDKSADPMLSGYEIEGLEDEPVWFAFFEGVDLWYEHYVLAAEQGDRVNLEFQPPFEGRWRTDLVRHDGVAQSSTFSNGAVARLDLEERSTLAIIVYPLDRTRATPLSVFCPTDVIRQALGVGPCQYVLQTEGLATETNPTPDQVMTWVEKQFQRDKTDESGEEIEELLAKMVEHVGHTEDRIERYVQFSDDEREILTGDEAKPRSQTYRRESLVRFNGLLQTHIRLQEVLGSHPKDLKTEAASLAQEVVQLLGKPDSLDECRRLGDELRQIGTQQDSTLSRCRMIVRWLNEQARTLAADGSKFAEPARKVQEACRRQLDSR